MVRRQSASIANCIGPDSNSAIARRAFSTVRMGSTKLLRSEICSPLSTHAKRYTVNLAPACSTALAGRATETHLKCSHLNKAMHRSTGNARRNVFQHLFHASPAKESSTLCSVRIGGALHRSVKKADTGHHAKSTLRIDSFKSKKRISAETLCAIWNWADEDRY